MKLSRLAIALSRLEGFPSPRPDLEQYVTPADLAARLLFDASLRGDICERRVVDLGCGTGVLAIGASLLGARDVRGVDIDPGALAVARRNAESAGADVQFLQGDIRDESLAGRIGCAETVVMNPPFGAQVPHADRPFIDAALRAAPVVWGIFNEGTLPFLSAYTAGRGEITGLVSARLAIPRTFAFHTRDLHEVGVLVLRIGR